MATKKLDSKKTRDKLGKTQAEFWSKLDVTQSGGSRYENGREMPKPVSMLFKLAYGTEAESKKLYESLRS